MKKIFTIIILFFSISISYGEEKKITITCDYLESAAYYRIYESNKPNFKHKKNNFFKQFNAKDIVINNIVKINFEINLDETKYFQITALNKCGQMSAFSEDIIYLCDYLKTPIPNKIYCDNCTIIIKTGD